MRNKVILIVTAVFFLSHQRAEACRFWGAVGRQVPKGLIAAQLIDMPNSLKALGKEYDDGWSVAHYRGGKDIVFRGSEPSFTDVEFDNAVAEVSRGRNNIVVAHLRRASSGCLGGIPNPHPFTRNKDGKRWLFGHNGGMKKQILIDLIGKEYLNNNQPLACTYDAPESWIDSELYFIFLLKRIEENGWDVEAGVKSGLKDLYGAIGPKDLYLNFFLTDGETLWAFRKGTTLFLNQESSPAVSVISSSVPGKQTGGWKDIPEGQLVVLKAGGHPRFVEVFTPKELKGD